jgi:manganese/zinc/iron transport system permease protein
MMAMDSFLEFITFRDPNIRYVVLGSVLLTASSAVMGTFALLNKKSLVGDAIAHALLPGICLGFLMTGTKDPVWIVAGAFTTGWISVYLIDFIVQHSRIKEDAAIALVLSVFFGFGVLLLTFIQKSGNAAQTGLDQFLFGRAASITRMDLIVFGITACLILLSVTVFFRAFTLLTFDRDYASALGFPVRSLRFLMTSLIVLSVVIGIQSVGVVLMAAVLITPATTALYWTRSVKNMLALAAGTGAFSGLAGSYISYLESGMPTGPWIVIVVSVIAFLSMIVAPEKGMLTRYLRNRQLRITMQNENVLKAFYRLGEEDHDFYKPRNLQDLLKKREIPQIRLQKILKRLHNQGYVEKSARNFRLTEAGYLRALRTVKLHRLWELYLTTYMNIAPDHVHDDAETMEHLLTPELEKELEQQLGYPGTDPHQATIPYRKNDLP